MRRRGRGDGLLNGQLIWLAAYGTRPASARLSRDKILGRETERLLISTHRKRRRGHVSVLGAPQRVTIARVIIIVRRCISISPHRASSSASNASNLIIIAGGRRGVASSSNIATKPRHRRIIMASSLRLTRRSISSKHRGEP